MSDTERKIKNNSWLLMKSVYGIKLSDAVNHEIKIDGVTLISRSKLSDERVRKRLNLLKPLKEIDTFDPDCQTIAIQFVYRENSIPYKVIQKEFEILVREISYIILSTVVHIPNVTFKPLINLDGKPSNNSSDFVIQELNEGKIIASHHRKRPYRAYTLKKEQLDSDKYSGFFLSYLKLNDSNEMNESMKKDIRNSIIFLGHSQNAIEPYISFLYNMIAIDCLLTSGEAKHAETAKKKIETLFGWTDLYNKELHKENIKNIYKIRASMVHDGKVESITREHVLYTEFILKNLLHNLCKYPSIFKSKVALDEFLIIADAERVLGISSMKSKVFPKKFNFFSNNNITLLK